MASTVMGDEQAAAIDVFRRLWERAEDIVAPHFLLDVADDVTAVLYLAHEIERPGPYDARMGQNAVQVGCEVQTRVRICHGLYKDTNRDDGLWRSFVAEPWKARETLLVQASQVVLRHPRKVQAHSIHVRHCSP